MPQKRIYTDPAERMRAYRQRRKARESGEANPGTPRRWIRELTTTRDSMQAYWDQRSERWQEGDRGQALFDRIEALTELIDELGV